ncbi:hypothetical protein EON79_21855 [bacterium]|nr:MAG: hypothetical protein EON79_21855 [bacterium]
MSPQPREGRVDWDLLFKWNRWAIYTLLLLIEIRYLVKGQYRMALMGAIIGGLLLFFFWSATSKEKSLLKDLVAFGFSLALAVFVPHPFTAFLAGAHLFLILLGIALNHLSPKPP